MVAFPARHWRTNRVPVVRPAATGPFGHFFELELNGLFGGWTDVTSDVRIDPQAHFGYGIPAAGPLDLCAGIGTGTFALDNSETNSAGLVGYYTPEGANCRPGFKRGIRVRYRYQVPGTYPEARILKFVGRLLDPAPVPGFAEERYTACSVVDWMYDAQSTKLNLPVQINQRSDQVVSAIIGAVPLSPGTLQLDTGDSVFPYALNNPGTSQTTAGVELANSCLSEFSRFYLKGGSGLSEMIARFEKRSARLIPMPVVSFTATMQNLTVTTDLRNKARVTGHPSTVDGAAVVLYSKPPANSQAVAPGQTVKVSGRYTDPALRASSVSGTSMVAPVAGTDYKMTANSDGTGAVLTANFTVSVVYGSNQADYLITNNGGTNAYVVIPQARGIGLYDYTPTTSVQADSASIALLGEASIDLDMKYQADLSILDPIAQFLIATWATPGFAEISMQFTPKTAAEMALMMALEPGDPVAVSEIVTGINGTYYIQNVGIDVLENSNATFTWMLQRALVTNYWQLGVSGATELGVTTVLAPL